jgi:uncharacterized protein YdeI (YjbR/CyaY-like superfamily)
LKQEKKWPAELTLLREIILECDLTEDFKWMHPCYTLNGKNVLLIHGFKEYCAVLFNKGALMSDPHNLLIQQTKNTQSARQIRFSDISEIEDLRPIIKEYILSAIEVEKSGLKVEKKSTSDYEVPIELIQKFEGNPDLEKAFSNLTPGRQRGYLLHFAQPKQSKTKLSRIENSIDKIMNGFGFNDCTCGLSKRMPNCDGSHKQLTHNK